MITKDTVPLGGTGASTLVHLSGDIDILTAARLQQQLLNALCYSTGRLVLDLSQVTFFGADGLSVLISVQSRARARGVTLVLTGVPPRVSRLLRITGLDGHFPVKV
ncbi:STAS domain-containing protein [Nonomuraea sp. CA-218870]|uniref:STAS domain-containing protein n=1 Tax=Nonomuraea sp. CA-218870 TaxID=3239998 RepID=UPI003D9398A5